VRKYGEKGKSRTQKKNNPETVIVGEGHQVSVRIQRLTCTGTSYPMQKSLTGAKFFRRNIFVSKPGEEYKIHCIAIRIITITTYFSYRIVGHGPAFGLE